MRWFCHSLSIALCVAVSASPVRAQLTSPQIGWQAELSTLFHNVSGTVSVLDPDTLQFDRFTYDGGGPAVYFYLGTEESESAFTTGLSIGMLLTGTLYDGTQPSFEVDLPAGQTLNGWNAISVWCEDFSANFGSGTFALPGDFNSDGTVDGEDFLLWQRDPSVGSLADWKVHYSSSVSLEAASAAVPEPSSGIALTVGIMAMLRARRRLR